MDCPSPHTGAGELSGNRCSYHHRSDLACVQGIEKKCVIAENPRNVEDIIDFCPRFGSVGCQFEHDFETTRLYVCHDLFHPLLSAPRTAHPGAKRLSRTETFIHNDRGKGVALEPWSVQLVARVALMFQKASVWRHPSVRRRPSETREGDGAIHTVPRHPDARMVGDQGKIREQGVLDVVRAGTVDRSLETIIAG